MIQRLITWLFPRKPQEPTGVEYDDAEFLDGHEGELPRPERTEEQLVAAQEYLDGRAAGSKRTASLLRERDRRQLRSARRTETARKPADEDLTPGLYPLGLSASLGDVHPSGYPDVPAYLGGGGESGGAGASGSWDSSSAGESSSFDSSSSCDSGSYDSGSSCGGSD